MPDASRETATPSDEPAGVAAGEPPDEHLGALMDSSPDPIVGVAPDGTITFWNFAAERVYGYSAAAALGQPLALLAPPGQEADEAALLQRVLQGEIIEDHETVCAARDGRLLDVSLTLFPVRDEGGQVIGAAATTREINPAPYDAAALAASEQRFRAAFDDAPNGMALLDLEGDFLQVNRAGCELLGRTEAELLALNAADVLHPEDVGLEDVAGDYALAGGRPDTRHQMRVQRPDGSVRWVQAQVSVIHDEGGEPTQYIVQAQDLTDQVRAREELVVARRQTQEMLERLGGAFIEVDTDWRITEATAATEGLLGKPRDVLVGHRLHDVLAPQVLDAVVDALQRTMTTRQRTQVKEFSCGNADTWLTMRAYPSANGITVYLHDVSAERHLEQELRVAELRFRALVEQLPAAVFMHADDSDQTNLYLSPYNEHLTGYSRDRQDIFQSFAAFQRHIHPDDQVKVERARQERAGRSGQFALEYRFRRADGSFIWVSDVYSSIQDDTGKIIAWLGILVDISAQKAASDAVDRLAAIVAASDEAIYARTVDGIITYWNPAAKHLYGYTAEEMIGQPIDVLFVDVTDRIVDSREALQRGEPQRFEARDCRKDGSVVDVSITLSPVRAADGTIREVAGIVRDITGRLAAERELRAALEAAEAGVRAKGLFLAMMSHELRTPLQAVLGYADFLLTQRPGSLSPEQREDIGYIHQGASRMVSLIEQMLDLSRMEAGRLELAREVVDVRAVLEVVRQDVAPQAEAKGLVLQLQTPRRLPRVVGDAERVRQIVLNLAGNAVKFTETGQVSLRARQRGGWLEVAVTDTGIGIAPQEQAAIFEEFRQVDSTLSRRHGGAGLGLAIARRLAEQMGGSITVESTPGHGATFTLRLPLARATSSADQADTPAPIPA